MTTGSAARTPPLPAVRSLVLPLAALALAALPARALAHDLWLERAGEAFVLRYGHHGGEALAIDPPKVKAMRCVEGGVARDVRASAAAAPAEVRVQARCDVVSAFRDGGYWSLTPDGERNLPRTQVADAVRSWASRQYAKWVDVRVPAARQPVGDELEIVPVTDLARAREGSKVTVRVLLDGKPVAGAVLAVDHKPIGDTDRAGEVRFRVRSRDVETVTTSLRRPLATPEADALVLEATLSFEVAR